MLFIKKILGEQSGSGSGTFFGASASTRMLLLPALPALPLLLLLPHHWLLILQVESTIRRTIIQ
jgi:hypothetical protein